MSEKTRLAHGTLSRRELAVYLGAAVGTSALSGCAPSAGVDQPSSDEASRRGDRCAAAQGWFDIRAFGGVGDAVINSDGTVASGSDSSPAVAAALAAAMAAQGGTIFVPAGNFLLRSPMAPVSSGLIFTEIVFKGLGSCSRLYVDAPSANAVSIDGTGAVIRFEDLCFLGNGTNNCGAFPIEISFALTLTFQSCLFFGMRSTGQSALYLYFCATTAFIDCYFGGMGTAANTYGVVAFVSSGGFEFIRTKFLDYATLNGVSYVPLGPACWLYAGDPSYSPPTGVAGNGRILLEDTYFDENPARAFVLSPSSGNRWYHVELVGVRVNASDQGADNFSLDIAQCDVLRIRDTWVGYTSAVPDTVGIRLVDAGDVVIEGYASNANTRTVLVDALTKRVLFRSCILYRLAFSSTPIPCFDETNSLLSRWRLTDSAVDANTLGKPGAIDGQVDQLGIGDDARLALGVILDVADGPGDPVRVVEQPGQTVAIKSDGADCIAPTAILTASCTTAGRVKATRRPGTSTIGMALSTAAASADALVSVIWSRSQY